MEKACMMSFFKFSLTRGQKCKNLAIHGYDDVEHRQGAFFIMCMIEVERFPQTSSNWIIKNQYGLSKMATIHKRFY